MELWLKQLPLFYLKWNFLEYEIMYAVFITADKVVQAKSNWATSWENLFVPYTNNNGEDSLRIRAVRSSPLLFASWIV